MKTCFKDHHKKKIVTYTNNDFKIEYIYLTCSVNREIEEMISIGAAALYQQGMAKASNKR